MKNYDTWYKKFLIVVGIIIIVVWGGYIVGLLIGPIILK